MHPSQFKRLLILLRSAADEVRTGLREIKESTDDQKEAIREGTETCEQKERKQRITIARAIVRASSTVPKYEETQRDKEYSLQWKMFWVTLGAAVAAAAAAVGAFYYAHIAAQQRDTMNNTYCEIKKQTAAAETTATAAQAQADLMKRQLEGTEGAILRLNLGFNGEGGQIYMGLSSSGIVQAQDIHLTVTATLETIAGKPIRSITLQPKVNEPTKGNDIGGGVWSRNIALPWPLPKISQQSENEFPSDWPGKTTIKLVGQYDYTNGFGTKYTPQPICKKWLPRYVFKGSDRIGDGGEVPCDMFDDRVRSDLASLGQAKKAKQQNK